MSVELSPFERRMERERAAGGFTRRDGTLAFYQRIDALLSPEMVVLDIGAGRGAQFERGGYVGDLLRLRGRVKRIVGVDVDPAVLQNAHMDEAAIISPGQRLPFEDGTFDLIYSDWVLEHIENPGDFASEINRLLKPGGWFCARTPGKWGYIALMANLVPASLHDRVLRRAQPSRHESDVFPKFYRLNTMSMVDTHFSPDRFLNASYTHNPPPAYHGGRKLLYHLIDFYQSLPFEALNTTLHVFVQKRVP